MSEIMIRIDVCSYINKNFGMDLLEFIELLMLLMVVFVRESMVKICELIILCYSIIDSDEIFKSMFYYI